MVGQMNGANRRFHENGNKEFETTYTTGDVSGEMKWYWPNGSLMTRIPTKIGYKHGKGEYYSDDGHVALYKHFNLGYIAGYSYKGTDGKEVPMVPLTNGTGHLVAYYENGKKSAEMDYDKGYLTGRCALYYYNGNIAEDEQMDKGRYHGVCKYYYSSGVLKEEVNYFHDEMHGKRTLYYDNGKVMREENYFYGELDGEVKAFDKYGKKQYIWLYHTGELVGEK
jgi:antitoxin component YwqK of YwqJK toxin-antitoxin module